MDLREGVADLHMHTTASDGTCTVGERVDQAVERDLDAIAVTDHDAISGDLRSRATVRSGVEVIAGVEVRGDVSGTKVEVLGYYVDPNDGGLRTVLARARKYRRERNREMVSNLAETTGLDLDYEELSGAVEGMLGRPHLAGTLVDAGVVDSIGAAFDEYLGPGSSAYVPMDRVPVDEVIDAIRGAGGVASLAHPGRIRSTDVPAIVADLVDAGLDGVEVKYPYDDAPSEGYADVDVEGAAALADEHGLLRTGGSDCHGPGSGKFRIGEVRLDEAKLDAIRGAADRLRAIET